MPSEKKISPEILARAKQRWEETDEAQELIAADPAKAAEDAKQFSTEVGNSMSADLIQSMLSGFEQRYGRRVDMQALEWGSVVQRRASREPIDKGGWNIFYTYLGGFGNVSPAPDIAIRGNGTSAWFGWPTNPKMEALYDAWFEAPDVPAQKKIVDEMQALFWQDPPYAPMGMYDQPTAFNKRITDVPEGWPQFYGLKKA